MDKLMKNDYMKIAMWMLVAFIFYKSFFTAIRHPIGILTDLLFTITLPFISYYYSIIQKMTFGMLIRRKSMQEKTCYTISHICSYIICISVNIATFNIIVYSFGEDFREFYRGIEKWLDVLYYGSFIPHDTLYKYVLYEASIRPLYFLLALSTPFTSYAIWQYYTQRRNFIKAALSDKTPTKTD